MARPTEDAILFFRAAGDRANSAILNVDAPTTAEQFARKQELQAIWSLAVGLEHLSVGLRATYILLEEVKGLIRR